MTQTEAHMMLNEAFPGKKHYISVHEWWHEKGVKADAPKFSVCVYLGAEGDHASGDGDTLGKAVERAIKNKPANRDAAAMFADPPTITPTMRASAAVA